MIPADAYFTYSVLAEDGETVMLARGGSEVRLRPSAGGCDARIVDATGVSPPSSFRSPRYATCPA